MICGALVGPRKFVGALCKLVEVVEFCVDRGFERFCVEVGCGKYIGVEVDFGMLR